MTETETKKEPEFEELEDNHYIVQGHYDGEHCDRTDYVLALTAGDAEEIFKEHYGKKEPGVEVFTTLVIQIPGPPIALFDEEGVYEEFNPLTKNTDAD